MVGCVGGGVGEGRVGEEGGEEGGILGVGEGVGKSFPVWVARDQVLQHLDQLGSNLGNFCCCCCCWCGRRGVAGAILLVWHGAAR